MISSQQSLAEGWVVSFGKSAVIETGRQEAALRFVGEADQSLPTSASDASCTVIFDGVLYNRCELRERFAHSTGQVVNDAHLVLQAYLCWGEDVLRRVKGIFALLIWDGTRRVFLGARDPLGVYPLFYADIGSALSFSTSVEALLRQPCVSRAVNRAAVTDYLLDHWPRLDETFYASVNRIPPGHAMRVDDAGRQVYRYWDPVPYGAPVHWVEEDRLEQFDTLLDQAVNRCLGLGHSGVYLSGGLDSVTVAALVADHCRRAASPGPWALSLGFPDPDCNEEAVQKNVAVGLGLPQVLLPFDEAVGAKGLLQSALDMTSDWPAPLQNIWNPAYYRLGLEGRRRGCEVILTGGGGDDWLTASPVYAADLLRALDFSGLVQFVCVMRRSYRLPCLPFMRNVLWTNGARLLLREFACSSLRRAAAAGLPRRMLSVAVRAHRRLSQPTPAWVAPDPVLRREIARRLEQDVDMRLQQREPDSLYIRDTREALDHPLMAMEFEEFFESGRRMGLRVLQPFWDPDLVDLLYRVPPHLLNKGGRSKGLVRGMLARRFPGVGFAQQKKVVATGFFMERVLGEAGAAWHTMGGVLGLARLGAVDPTPLNGAFQHSLAHGRLRDAQRVWNILNLEAWVRPRL